MRTITGPLTVIAYQHFVITRFNLPIAGGSLGLDADWLTHRLKIFREICAPSISRQTTQAFDWLVFFDRRTPTEVRDQVDDLARRFHFQPIWAAKEFSAPLAGDEVVQRVGDARFVITTRLDNDDALHSQFVARVQSQFRACPAYLNFPFGCQLVSGNFYLRIYLGSPFLSRIEAAQDIRTVYEAEHWRPEKHRPAQLWTARPAWLQVVHGRNVANEVRGIWTRADQLTEAFGVPLSYVAQGRIGRVEAAIRRARSLQSVAPTQDLWRRLKAVTAMLRR